MRDENHMNKQAYSTINEYIAAQSPEILVMSLSIFGEKAVPPNNEMLEEALADSKTLWADIEHYAESICGGISGQWKFYSKKPAGRLLLGAAAVQSCT